MGGGGELKSVLVGMLLVVFVGSAFLAHTGAAGAARAETAAAGAPMEYLPSADAVGALSLGHRSALADLFWIRAVLYFGAEVASRRSFEWLVEYLDVILALDPKFRDAYLWGGAVLVISNSVVKYEHVELANQLLEKGAERFPDDFKIPEAAAANCSYYVKNPSEAEVVKLKACRKKFIEIAASRPGSNMALMASALADGDEARACGLLIDAYFAEQADPELRAQVENRMRGGLCGNITPEHLEKQEKAFAQYTLERYPYLLGDLTIHIVSSEGLYQNGVKN